MGATDMDTGAPDHIPVLCLDDQAAQGELQMAFPATLVRVDATPTDWNPDNAAQWRFGPASASGASDFYLDLWGNTLTVPREPGESDSLYAPRVLVEVLRPTITNVGLASSIDASLGIMDTQVLDAVTEVDLLRFDEGDIFDSDPDGLDFDEWGGLADTPWCCFIVLLHTSSISPYSFETVERLVDRRKAAGTRLLWIAMVPGYPIGERFYRMDFGPDGWLYVVNFFGSPKSGLVKVNPFTGTIFGFVGDPLIQGHVDGDANTARFSDIKDIKWGADGNLYVLDYNSASGGHTYMRKVLPDGTTSTLWTLAAGTAGDEGTDLNNPAAFEVDETASNFYVLFNGGCRIFKVTSGGTATVFAGHYSPSTVGNEDGTAGAAYFGGSGGLAFSPDYSFLVLCDAANNNLRKITVPGAVVTTLAGQSNTGTSTPGASGMTDANGASARFNAPASIRRGSDNVYYIADMGNDRIRAFNITTGDVTTTDHVADPSSPGSYLAVDAVAALPSLVFCADGTWFIRSV